MEQAEDAVKAIRGLDNTEFQGGMFSTKLWTLIYLAKFRLPLPFLPSAHLPVFLVPQYFCSFPFMVCSPSRPHCVQKLWWGLCCFLASCFQWVLNLGMTLVRVSLLLSLFGPKACD
ncbi:hypothetical protein GH733_012066, partial [Mirounga leonina]